MEVFVHELQASARVQNKSLTSQEWTGCVGVFLKVRWERSAITNCSVRAGSALQTAMFPLTAKYCLETLGNAFEGTGINVHITQTPGSNSSTYCLEMFLNVYRNRAFVSQL